MGDKLVSFSYSPEQDHKLSNQGKSFLGFAMLDHIQLKKLVEHANVCLTRNSKLEIHIFGGQTPQEVELIDEIQRLKNAMLTANIAMRAIHNYLKDILQRMTVKEAIIKTKDALPIITKLARAIETLDTWGCHE